MVKWHLGAMLLLAAFGAAPACAQSRPDKGTPFFEKGLELYKANDYATAESLLREGLRQSPDDSLAHYYLGKAIQGQRPKDPEVLREFKRSYVLDSQAPHSVEVFMDISRIERAQAGERAIRDAADAEFSSKLAFLNGLAGRCFQARPDIGYERSEVCACFERRNSPLTADDTSLTYTVTDKGTGETGSSYRSWWLQYDSRCSAKQILQTGSKYNFLTECSITKRSNSWFINEMPQTTVRLAGKDVIGLGIGGLEFNLATNTLKFGNTQMSPGCNMK